MKVLKLIVLFIFVLGLTLIVINTKFIGGRWLLFNTNFGPLRLNSSAQVNLFFSELGTMDGELVFFRNREINSMKGYWAWNPLNNDFGKRIVLACKVNKVMGLVNVVFVDVDAKRIKSSNSQTKANNFLPNLTTKCLTNSLMKNSMALSDDKIQKLIDLSQGMLMMK